MRRLSAFLILWVLVAGPVQAATRILFIGNSFTYGSHSAALRFHADQVHDLNQDGYGGMPALFKAFTAEAGLDYDVSLETRAGQNFDFHYNQKLSLIDQPWDVVVMQGHSLLDGARPGDASVMTRYAGLLADRFHARNPKVDIRLLSTWSRADQTYLPTGHWYGQPITAMADDIRKANDRAQSASPYIHGVLPVGQAWNLAIKAGVADPNPYDGISPGQVNLWGGDNYHGSIYGYYLETLIVFGAVTGRDPRELGPDEKCADDLGISKPQAKALQQIAYETLAREKQP